MTRNALFEFRRGTAATWTSSNPTLAAGEPGFETDTGKLKIGDGSTAWNSLAYIGGSSGVTSFNTRTGAVVPVTGDYGGVVASFLTGATAASRYAGATTSGAPVSGTFAKGDFIIDQTGQIWICTVAGSPGTWINPAANAGVSSLNSLSGALSIVAGTNITVTPSGSNITIDATGGTSWTTVATCSTDRTVTNTTATDITDLSVALTSGHTYEFEVLLQVASQTTAGSKFAVAFTGTQTSEFTGTVTSNQTTGSLFANTVGGGLSSAVNTSAADGLVSLKGMIIVTANGNLTAQAARVSPSTTTTIRGGSSLKVRQAL